MMLFSLLLVGLSADFQIDRTADFNPYVIVNYEIPYSNLIFHKNDSIYKSEYLVSLILMQDGYQVGGKTDRVRFFIDDYQKTVSSNFFHSNSIQMEVPTGKMNIILKVSDLNSSRIWNRSKELEVSELSPTDIGAVRWLSNPSREVVRNEDTVKIKISVFSKEEGEIKLKYFFNNDKGSTLFMKDTLLPDKESQSVEIIIPAGKFEENKYTFFAEVSNVKRDKTAQKSISFRVWEPFFESERFIKRVEQISYIATSNEIDEMLSARGEKREKLWNEFWESKDPTPADGINEFKIKYFERVNYANKHFSDGLFEGWRTDRGEVYIILGPPDYIEDRPYESGGASYQIWYYYQQNYKLVFVQRYITGSYRLINPPPEVKY